MRARPERGRPTLARSLGKLIEFGARHVRPINRLAAQVRALCAWRTLGPALELRPSRVESSRVGGKWSKSQAKLS